jgi:hypothetical protein
MECKELEQARFEVRNELLDKLPPLMAQRKFTLVCRDEYKKETDPDKKVLLKKRWDAAKVLLAKMEKEFYELAEKYEEFTLQMKVQGC